MSEGGLQMADYAMVTKNQTNPAKQIMQPIEGGRGGPKVGKGVSRCEAGGKLLLRRLGRR